MIGLLIFLVGMDFAAGMASMKLDIRKWPWFYWLPFIGGWWALIDSINEIDE